MKYRIAIAGSTNNTVSMAKALAKDDRFEISWTLSPTPKTVGRKKELIQNPLHVWSQENKIKTFLVEQKINRSLLKEFEQNGEIDFLLVVDFGYFIPNWLLKLPKIAPLNIHPSLLPKWRGSSPGQFCILFQDLDQNSLESAVTLMIMNSSLDQGPILTQLPFTLKQNWTQNEYYQAAFALIKEKLADLINDFANKKIQPIIQPDNSPTMVARRLSKEDSFVSWTNLLRLMNEQQKTKIEEIEENNPGLLTDLLNNQNICENKSKQITLIKNASLAFSPWPNLWTIIPTTNGEKRMKILACHKENEVLILDQVQIEGKNLCTWNECKNILKS